MQLSHSYAIPWRAVTVGIFTIRGDRQCEEIRYQLQALDLYSTIHHIGPRYYYTTHYTLHMSLLGSVSQYVLSCQWVPRIMKPSLFYRPGWRLVVWSRISQSSRHHNQGRPYILSTAGVSLSLSLPPVSFMVRWWWRWWKWCDGVEMFYWFISRRRCGSPAPYCGAADCNNRSMTPPGSGSALKLSVVCCSALSRPGQTPSGKIISAHLLKIFLLWPHKYFLFNWGNSGRLMDYH